MSTLEWIFGGMSLAELVTLITTLVMLIPQRKKADEEVNQARASKYPFKCAHIIRSILPYPVREKGSRQTFVLLL